MAAIRTLFIATAMIFLFSNCSNQEKDSSSSHPSVGKKYYQRLCASCHGKKGDLKLSKAADLSISTLSEDAIFEIISNGKGSMPSFKKYLNEKQIDLVSAYTLTLRKETNPIK